MQPKKQAHCADINANASHVKLPYAMLSVKLLQA